MADDLTITDNQCTMSKERQGIALSATCEISALCDLLRDAANSDNGDLAIRGLSARIKDLASIANVALGDELDSTTELNQRLNGLH